MKEREMNTQVWQENQSERGRLEDLNKRIIQKWVLKREYGEAWIDLIWLKTGISVELLGIR